MKEEKPDFITKATKVVSLGEIESKLIVLNDKIILQNKQSNDSLQSGYWIQLGNQIYYFKKPTFTQGYLNELLGVKITEYFGLPTVHYQLAQGIVVNHHGEKIKIYGLLSPWAREESKQYQTIEQQIYSDIITVPFKDRDLSLFSYLDQKYRNQPICKEMRLLVVRDFFTQERDRLESEILIARKEEKVELGILSDYEYEWGEPFSKVYHIPKYFKLDPNDDLIVKQIQEDFFLQEAFDLAMNCNVLELLEQVQDEHQIRLIDYDRKHYQNQESRIKQLIRAKKLYNRLN